MDPQQYQVVKSLFARAAELAPEARISWLERECDDPAVRAQVRALLQHDERDQDGIELLSRMSRRVNEIFSREAPPPEDFVGRDVGPYKITELVGQGGMGVVYLGVDQRLSRKTALKAVRPEDAASAMRIERLRREARVLASLSHPNIATIFGLEEAHGTLFIAMEYIEGKTLSQRLGRSSLPVAEALAVAEQVAAGVEAAHEAGIIHRDLKPGNVMFTADGVAKVLDFGLARELATDRSRSGDTRLLTLTRQGSLFGTPAYMSPEQARGEVLDRRSDIFSFGCVLYRMLAGRPAFDGETDAELIDAILNREPDYSRLPESTPASIRQLMRRCLAKQPADRYRHIGDARLDLRDALSSRAWEAPPVAKAARLRRVLPWAAALVLSLSAGAGGVWWSHRASGTQTTAPGSQRFDLTLPEAAPQVELERLQVAIAPDGRHIVAALQTSTGQELWRRSTRDGVWTRIANTQGAHRPVLSRDGQWVLYYRDGHLYKQRVTGSDPIRVGPATNWYGAGWTDSGGIIYAPAWGDPLAQVQGPTDPLRLVTTIDSDTREMSNVSPLVIPETDWVLYTSWQGGEEASIHATDLKTGAEHVVASNGSMARLASTPKGDYLLYERVSTLFAVPFDRTTATLTGPEVAIVTGVMTDITRWASYYDVADDGTIVYIPGSTFVEESRVAYVNPDGTTSVPLLDRAGFSEPYLSTDGKRLAVVMKGKIYTAVVYDLERQTSETVLTGGDTVSVAFDPEAKRLATVTSRDGGYGVDLIDLKTGARERIVQPGADYPSNLHWSKDGNLILFSMSAAEGVPRDLWAKDLRDLSQPPRPIAATSATDSHGNISPDGRWVAYGSDITGKFEIYLTPLADNGRARQITVGGGHFPVWSPDGTQLYYVDLTGRLMSLPMSLEEGSPTGRASVAYDKPFGQADPLTRNYTIAPDGRPLIVEPTENRPKVSCLNIITNWWRLLP